MPLILLTENTMISLRQVVATCGRNTDTNEFMGDGGVPAKPDPGMRTCNTGRCSFFAIFTHVC